ncbi:MAG TPA: hypothetical protein VF146_18265 [Bryobacteraceae bacterium]
MSEAASLPIKSRPCCDEDYCVRKQLDQLDNPELPLAERIACVASHVARTCQNLTRDELDFCAGRLFELTPECDLTMLFKIAYETEAAALQGRKEIIQARAKVASGEFTDFA